MPSRRPLLILAIVVPIAVACVLLIMASMGPTEPSYKGLTMIQWLWVPDTPAKEEALIILGTNHLQLLVHRLTYDPTKDRVFALYSRLPDQLKNVRFLRNLCAKNVTQAAVASKVMKSLGPRAAPAIPELAQIAKNASEIVSCQTLMVLHDIGEPAVPGMVAGMSNTNPNVRGFALFFLGRYRNSPAAWHAITNALADPDPKIRKAADIAARTNLE